MIKKSLSCEMNHPLTCMKEREIIPAVKFKIDLEALISPRVTVAYAFLRRTF